MCKFNKTNGFIRCIFISVEGTYKCIPSFYGNGLFIDEDFPLAIKFTSN